MSETRKKREKNAVFRGFGATSRPRPADVLVLHLARPATRARRHPAGLTYCATIDRACASAIIRPCARAALRGAERARNVETPIPPAKCRSRPILVQSRIIWEPESHDLGGSSAGRRSALGLGLMSQEPWQTCSASGD